MGLIGFLGFSAVVRADLIYFNKGGDAQLPARVEGNRVLVSMPDGQVELTRENVRKIIPGFWPDAEWSARRRECAGSRLRGTIRSRLVGP